MYSKDVLEEDNDDFDDETPVNMVLRNQAKIAIVKNTKISVKDCTAAFIEISRSVIDIKVRNNENVKILEHFETENNKIQTLYQKLLPSLYVASPDIIFVFAVDDVLAENLSHILHHLQTLANGKLVVQGITGVNLY